MNLMERMNTDFESLTLSERILGGIEVALFGVGIVFFILILIMLIIMILKNIFTGSSKAPANEMSGQESDPIPEVEEEVYEEMVQEHELVAIITAALAMRLETSTHNIIVRNIHRTADHNTTWSRVTRVNQMNR
ncbi:OadG family transporter subunit [Serpentinicella sp. ANB-PHB4]|uniref:OadG family transporter subunit n=1 Tax=Serpentinicella sp. ANB-PHB4 TaxID=3074076 RepID=UPI002864968D|nr:OadG family transporter subunit [Serpentinicella sp. ANB-PHB4]MDR5659117.1 OadG family transporter subunit [Serpentinicella sp. ANB-PHB4]